LSSCGRRRRASHIMMGSIFVNLGLQLMVVVAQNFKLGWRKVLKEVLVVLTCIKPGVDAFRVASGTEIVEEQVCDPNAEMAYMNGPSFSQRPSLERSCRWL